MSDWYFERLDVDETLGERFHASDMVRGTWSADMQHGAPPSALVVRALERCATRVDTRLSRVVVDLLGPVPTEGDLWVRAKVERPGRQIELVTAEMLARASDGGARPVVRASGWRLQRQDTSELTSAPDAQLRPISEASDRELAKEWRPNYLHSIDWRWLTAPLNDGPGESWMRPMVELVKGETLTPLQRLFTVADCANGIGSKIDIRRWTFLNTDLAVHIHRVPEGEWIGIRAETSYGPDGIGAACGTLFDEQGAVGVIQESVLVRRRGERTG